MNDDPPSQRPLTAHGEAGLLAIIAAELDGASVPADLDDDCARLAGRTDLVTADTLVEGVHFELGRDGPEHVGAQAAVQNLSDLAASGCGPSGLWLVWSLCLPAAWDVAALGALTRGFARTAARHGARVVGGNLSRTPGPAVIAVTAGGPLAGARPLTRRGARAGDAVYVTGALGDAALGVVEHDASARAARHRWRPHLAEAAALAVWGRVTAMMDVSDGLLLDAARLAAASGVAVDLRRADVPVSDFYRSRRGDDLDLALHGGEDYVLLFTAPPAEPPPVRAWRVGHCAPGAGLRLDGEPARPQGYDHFA